ncbi:hypothetical protein DE4576_01721 [Mycobacterium marinum]|uniref:Uncharacterized protein n=1 Tax=Mycobacterium marinum TaxID=1781 RepID=A0A3E2MMS2_MYCMR|nr:hypothetical protein DAVIS_05532 [Mycobacterium marinum]RFZ68258.1 hypothetical protein DE4576_01721 [Mycobacterium marinum]
MFAGMTSVVVIVVAVEIQVGALAILSPMMG